MGLQIRGGDPVNAGLHQVDPAHHDHGGVDLPQAHGEHVEQPDARAGEHRLDVQLGVAQEEDEEADQEQAEHDEADDLEDAGLVAGRDDERELGVVHGWG